MRQSFVRAAAQVMAEGRQSDARGLPEPIEGFGTVRQRDARADRGFWDGEAEGRQSREGGYRTVWQRDARADVRSWDGEAEGRQSRERGYRTVRQGDARAERGDIGR